MSLFVVSHMSSLHVITAVLCRESVQSAEVGAIFDR